MDDFNLEQLAKEIVVKQLSSAHNIPVEAGNLARQLITQTVSGTKNRQIPNATVTAVCKGLASGILLLDGDLPKTTVAILGQMSSIASLIDADPAEVMTWALEGIAPVAKLSGTNTLTAVRESVDATFMGAGEVFSLICQRIN